MPGSYAPPQQMGQRPPYMPGFMRMELVPTCPRCVVSVLTLKAEALFCSRIPQYGTLLVQDARCSSSRMRACIKDAGAPMLSKGLAASQARVVVHLHTSWSSLLKWALFTAAGPHQQQQQQYGPPPNLGGYAPPLQQSYPPPDRAGPPPFPGMGPPAGPPSAGLGQRESEMRQEEQRRKRFREFKEEKPVRRLILSAGRFADYSRPHQQGKQEYDSQAVLEPGAA